MNSGETHFKLTAACKSPNLKQRSKRSATYWAIVGLVSETVRTGIAETQVPTGKDEGVPHVAHADHALGPCVLHFVISKSISISTVTSVYHFVLNAINLLKVGLKCLIGA